MTKKNEIKLTASIVRELLRYDPHTGIFTWKERRLEWFKSERSWKHFNNRFAGKPAGTINTGRGDYCTLLIGILGKMYTGPQLAYLYMTGEWASGYLTPVNGDSLDIRIDNLLENMHGKARRIRSDNRSGVTGIHWSKRDKRWVAMPGLNGKPHHLGYFTDFSEAEEVVESFYREHGFLPRHGTPIAA